MQTRLSSVENSFWRSAGAWLVMPMVALMLINFVRTLADPAGFAAYLGLPLQHAADFRLVQVYGLRALFIGLFAAYLLWQQNAGALKWFAWLAILMAVGDAWLVYGAGGAQGIVIRHLGTAVYLLIAGFALHRQGERGLSK